MKVYNNKNLILAKNLRKNMTPWERKLWFNFLKQCGHKFYTQRRIGNYILDFYCSKAHLAVELDGGQHYSDQSINKDNERTAFLLSKGIKVIRFSNREVDENFDGVCESILNSINQNKENLWKTIKNKFYVIH